MNAEEQAGGPEPGTYRVLVVEDEPLMRSIIVQLARSDGYAYDIANRLSELIGMGEGTIYPLMRRMQADGLVKTYLEESSSGPPRKYYQLTKAGHAALVAQKVEWNGFVAAVARVLSDTKASPAAKIVGVLK